MSLHVQSLRSLLRLLATVKNPLPPLFDRLGLPVRPYQVRLRDGTVFDMRPGRGDWYSFNDCYLWNPYQPVGKPLSPGDKVIDIGANIGCFSVYAARAVGPTGQVIAVEPAPDTFHQLRRNLDANHLTNVVASQVAVAETAGVATLHLAQSSIWSSFYEDIAAMSTIDLTQEVTTVTLDQLLAESGWDRCQFLKLDCEGAEHGIVRGMTAETAAKIDQIGMEIHSTKGFDSQSLIDRLKSFGFAVDRHGGVFRFWRPAA